MNMNEETVVNQQQEEPSSILPIRRILKRPVAKNRKNPEDSSSITSKKPKISEDSSIITVKEVLHCLMSEFVRSKHMKHRRKQPEDGGDSTCRMKYRCGFNGIWEFFNNYFEEDEDTRKKDSQLVWFTEPQLEKLKDSPFWNVLQFFIYEKTNQEVWWRTDDAIDKMVLKYSLHHRAFVFDNLKEPVFVKSTSEKLAAFFGLKKKKKIRCSGSDTGEEIKTPSEEKGIPIIKRMQDLLPVKRRNRLEKLHIEKSIRFIMAVPADQQTEQDVEDLVILFTLYLCVTVFFTRKCGSLSRNKFEGYFTSLHKMNRTCWADLIHSNLMKKIRGHILQPLEKQVSGCSIHLLYLFAEHNPSMIPKNFGFPRFKRWTIAAISTTIENNVDGAMSKMSPELTNPILAEEQKLIQEEYQENKNANDTDTLKQDLYESEMLKNVCEEDFDELLSDHTELVNFIEEQKNHLQKMKDEGTPESVLRNLYLQTLRNIFDFTRKLPRRNKQIEAVAAPVLKEQCDLQSEEQSGLINADKNEKEDEGEEKKEENEETEQETGTGLEHKEKCSLISKDTNENFNASEKIESANGALQNTKFLSDEDEDEDEDEDAFTRGSSSHIPSWSKQVPPTKSHYY